ncbi:hypothetical protein APHAL10511_000022 [Amanita phalloides]|nr:hypothetical protein APHAL10511_000022 [Amanita phalloides]
MSIQADSENLLIKDDKTAASPSPSASSVPVSAPRPFNFLEVAHQNQQPDVKASATEHELKAIDSLSPVTCIPDTEQEQKTAASLTPRTSIPDCTRPANAMGAMVEKGKTTASPSPPSTIPGNHKVSAHFNAKDADITFQSVDNVLYYVHRKNLECAATGFAKATTNSDKHTIIQMTEESDILDLLLGFTYPKPTPNVKDLPFKTLSKLASAAEKYKVYSAITICNIYMVANVEAHPIGVLRYAASYCYVELLDRAAPIAIQERLGVVVSELPPEVAIAWVYYYQEWSDAVRELTDPRIRPSSCTCTAWPSICLGILDRIAGKVKSLFDLDTVFAKPTTGCLGCLSNVSVWHNQANEMYANMSKFSEYLFPKPSKTNTGAGRKKSRTATPKRTSTASAGDQTHGHVLLQSIIASVTAARGSHA